MNTKRLSNLATVLRDAQQQKPFVDIFSFEVWGFTREEEDRYMELEEAWPIQYEEETLDYDEKNLSISQAVTLVPHNCGAPACALGHYALRTDMQDQFVLSEDGQVKFARLPKNLPHYVSGAEDTRIAEHFGITPEDAGKLFGPGGCNGAETPGEAANYIEYFIKKRS